MPISPSLRAGLRELAEQPTWQLADGAIAWYVDRQRIKPYLGNYAAIGLAEAYRVTHTNANLTAASSWLSSTRFSTWWTKAFSRPR